MIDYFIGSIGIGLFLVYVFSVMVRYYKHKGENLNHQIIVRRDYQEMCDMMCQYEQNGWRIVAFMAVPDLASTGDIRLLYVTHFVKDFRPGK